MENNKEKVDSPDEATQSSSKPKNLRKSKHKVNNKFIIL